VADEPRPVPRQDQRGTMNVSMNAELAVAVGMFLLAVVLVLINER
jgi:hypothetical protein